MIYFQLFLLFQIVVFSFSGGYAAVPLIQGQVGTRTQLGFDVRSYQSHHHLSDETPA